MFLMVRGISLQSFNASPSYTARSMLLGKREQKVKECRTSDRSVGEALNCLSVAAELRLVTRGQSDARPVVTLSAKKNWHRP